MTDAEIKKLARDIDSYYAGVEQREMQGERTPFAKRIKQLHELLAKALAANDAQRYRTLRYLLYQEGSVEIGEAVVSMRVIGACPDTEEFDRELDAHAAKERE